MSHITTGGSLNEDYQYFKISLPSHAGFSPQPELENPTTIAISLPPRTNRYHVTCVPDTNVNMTILNVFVQNNLLNVVLAWWSGPFDLYIGFA